MKVILSRKGFDSSYGGCPSAILPDGRMVSFPIPSEVDDLSYSDLYLDVNTRYSDLLKRIVKSKRKLEKLLSSSCHLDPDLIEDVLPNRLSGWRGAFGQIGAAETVLENNSVGKDDLFIFFGWYNHLDENELRFKSGGGFHALYGYLQIGEIYKSDDSVPEWLVTHPHRHESRLSIKNNTIYTARERTSWNENIPGYGVFRFSPELVLTKPELSRSRWELPDFFRDLKITYHSKKSWKEKYFQSACIGQEFVIEESSKVSDWARGIIERNKN